VNHADIKRHLADYLEGELPIDQRALVDAHLDSCDSCAGEVDEMLQTIRLLRTLPEPEMPPMIAANVMRRIRSGESQLGFFGRLGRMLGGVLEPGFVLPASAIAAAALVVTVVKCFGDGSISNVGREDGRLSVDRAESSTASVASLSANRRGEQARRSNAYGASGAGNGMDFVARVERRAAQSDQALQGDRRSGLSLSAAGPGTRIIIKFEGLGLERKSISQPPTSPIPLNPRFHPGTTSSVGTRLTSRIPNESTMNHSGVPSSKAFNLSSPGMLVVAQRLGEGEFLAGTHERNTRETRETRENQGGSDTRDAWLALGIEDPAEFARYIAGRNLAEQELWASRLSERAETQGILDEFLGALRESGDPTAVWVADDFSAQAEETRSHLLESDDISTR